TGREIGRVAERFEDRAELPGRNAAVEARDRADLRIAKRRNDRSEIIPADANVAVADNENIVARFAGHPRELVDLVGSAELLRAFQQANAPIRKIADDFLEHWNCGIVLVRNVKKNFIFGIIEIAEARV